MAAWIANGRVLDFILIAMVLEGAALVAFWRVFRRGVRPRDLLPNLFSGMCLLTAMRVGLGGGWWGWVSLPLLGALVFHVGDLWGRWRS